MADRYCSTKEYNARQSIGYLIRQARSLITARLESAFSGEQVTFTQWVVLMCLREGIALTPSEMCQYLSYDSGAFTRLLDQMEERGLLTRARSTMDRRVVKLALTEFGQSTADALIAIVVRTYNDMLQDFSVEESDMLVGLLGKLTQNLSVQRKKGL